VSQGYTKPEQDHECYVNNNLQAIGTGPVHAIVDIRCLSDVTGIPCHVEFNDTVLLCRLLTAAVSAVAVNLDRKRRQITS
jgi:hypothetical protein